MRHFLYDEINNRLVLVDGLYPSIELEKSDRGITPNSKQQRIYNSLYIWEDVKLSYSNEVYYLIHKDKKIIEFPIADCCIIYGGAYQYNESKIS
jgi:hypothetical protein